MKKPFVTLVSIILVSACGGNGSIKNEITCTGNDWAKIGYNSAIEGNSIRLFDKYREHCGEYLEDNALNLYAEGYTKGIIEYCTYENGYQLGNSNMDLRDVCPVEVRSAFARGYKHGQIEFKTTLKSLQDEQERMLNRSLLEGAAKNQAPSTGQ